MFNNLVFYCIAVYELFKTKKNKFNEKKSIKTLPLKYLMINSKRN